jgi:hypothetical protein
MRKPYGLYPPAMARLPKVSCTSPAIPAAFCCAGGVAEAAVPVRVPMGSGLLVVTAPVVSWMTALPLTWPESRKTGRAMKVRRAPVPSGTEASKSAEREERLL